MSEWASDDEDSYGFGPIKECVVCRADYQGNVQCDTCESYICDEHTTVVPTVSVKKRKCVMCINETDKNTIQNKKVAE
jgi:hypothetical protein